jgi:multidrug efflux pump subunit AcrB
MRGLINLFVRRPITVIMILAAQIIAAIFCLFSLPVNRLPDFSVPRVTVETLYPGMAANEIRTLVTIPLEDGLSPIKGLERIRSISRDNRSLISMDFRWGTDPMAASVLVREAIDAVYPSLPEGVRKPAVTAGDSVNEPHAVIAVSSHNGNGEFARKLAEYEMRARLRRIDGVGSVVLVGGDIAEERISLDVPRLAALGLAPSEFAGILSQETADIPAGNAREGNMELVVVSSGKPDSTAYMAQIILPVANGTLTVEDAGEIMSTYAKRESIFVCNGKETTALEIYRRHGADPLRLSKEIKKTVDTAANLFSRDVQIEIVHDSTPSLVSGIRNLLTSASFGAIAVITVLLFFIRQLKYSLLASFSIPFSVAAGICMLSLTGKSLNSMSLGGLAIGIGLVSDISVIVLDLLHRSFGKNVSVPKPQEIGNKAGSIAGSSIASTFTTAIVFVPIFLLPGPLGSLFSDISISLVAVVFAGWLYAQLFLPSLYRLFFNLRLADNTSDKKKKIFNTITSVYTDGSLEKKYTHFLTLLFHRPKKFFAVAVILTFLGFLSLALRPVVFINPDTAEEVWVSVVFPPGTLLESVSSAGISLYTTISGLPSVKTVFGRAGAQEEDVMHRADIDYLREELILRCVLKKGKKPDKALAEINDAITSIEKYTGNQFSVYFPKDKIEVLLGLSTGNTFIIKGKDRDELLEHIEITENALKEAVIPAYFKPRGKRPELRFFPNRSAAAYLSIPSAQIAETLYILNEGIVAARLEIEGRPLDVRVTGQFSQTGDPVHTLEQIPLRTSQGKTVYLGSLGRIERKEAEASLARIDRSDVIYADILAEKNISSFIKKFTAQFSWFTGADESVFKRYKNSLFLYVILVLILLYMTMGAQFESFLLPVILMICIPFSLAGAGPALLFTGTKIDSGAILGLTALFGLVLNNSLLLYEISDQKIRCGLSPVIAVLRGSSERLQAILITLATTVFALLPLVISPMANSQKSMAAAMLGGLAASTLLSLFAIPLVLIKYFKWKSASGEST